MNHLMRQQIHLYPSPSVDGSGKKTWSAHTTYDSRFVEQQKVFIDKTGERQVADAYCWLPKDVTEIYLGSRIDYNNKEYRVLTIKTTRDGMGNVLFHLVSLQEYAS